jgi:hypothetical protein
MRALIEVFRHLYIYKRSIYQDRLGTTKGKHSKKRRRVFSLTDAHTLQVGGGGARNALRKTALLSYLYIKTIILPRQARDKHRENSTKDAVFRTAAEDTMRTVCKTTRRLCLSAFPMLVPSQSWQNDRFLSLNGAKRRVLVPAATGALRACRKVRRPLPAAAVNH